jgi:hypothetical protein
MMEDVRDADNGCEMDTNEDLFLEGSLFVQEDLRLYQRKGLRPRSREDKYKSLKVWAGK